MKGITFVTIKKKSTGEYLYINAPCELLGLTNDIANFKVGERIEQVHSDFYYWIFSNFLQEFDD